MNLELTLTLIAIFGSIFALAAWRSSRPSNPAKVRMIPWTMVAIISATFAIILMIHLASLFGIESGGGRGRRL